MAKSQEQRDKEEAGFGPKPLELAIIGFILTQPERFYEVAELRSFHFTSPTRRKVFDVLASMANEAGELAIESRALLQTKLAEAGIKDDDSFDLITDAKDFAPQSTQALEPIKEKLITLALRRSLDEAAREVQQVAKDQGKNADELCEAASDLIGKAIRKGTVVQMGTLAEELEAEVQRVLSGGGEEVGYDTGFAGLTEKLNGLHGGELIVIAGRPGMGKSSILNRLAVTLSYEQRLPGGIFSLEMRKAEIAQRIICNVARINSHAARSRSMNDVERGRYLDWAQRLMSAEMWFYDSGGISAARIGAITRRLYHENGLRWIAVDYLQQVDHMQRRNESTTDAISRTSRAMKMLALSLDIPVILLSQLNREPDKRDNKRPKLMDLRSSGSIEQDADVVLFLYRDDYYHGEDQEWCDRYPEKLGKAEIIIGKQRNGPTGVIQVAWEKECAGFSDLVGASDYAQADAAYLL
jgi:replicative DNA helicase